MRLQITLVSITLFGLMSAALAENGGDGARTGYFETETTLLELLGEAGASSMSDVIAADEKLKWKIYVPKTYTPTKPVGVIVFLTYSDSWGGSTRAYNPVLDDKNIIWAGLVGAGDKKTLNGRMMRALLTPTFLARDYVLDSERMFIGGTSGGALVASILATSKPQFFKGGLFIGGGVGWKDKEPAAIAQVRQNRYVFLVGSKNPALNEVRSIAFAYREAGIENTDLIVMPNVGRKAPTANYIRRALEFLDEQEVTEQDE